LKSKISIKFRVITGLGTPLALFQVKGEQEMWVAYKEIALKNLNARGLLNREAVDKVKELHRRKHPYD